MKVKPDTTCGICYEAITDSPQHMFCCSGLHTLHHACMLKWMAHQHFQGLDRCCPFCRKPLLSAQEFDILYASSTQPQTSTPTNSTVSVIVPSHDFDSVRLVRITYQTHLCMVLNILLLLLLLFCTKK